MSDKLPPAFKVIRTPRFLDGITVGDLRTLTLPVQKETMAVWFMEHYTPATDTYFGFDEQAAETNGTLDISRLGDFKLDDGPKVGGFDVGAFFKGGRAPDLLTATFSAGVGPAPIEEVATIFGGLWEEKPLKPPVKSYTAPDDVRTAISKELDVFEARFRTMTPEYGGIGHNGPPEDLLVTADEKAIVLRTVFSMRMAVSSGDDPSVLDAVWSGLSDITCKIGGWLLKQVDVFFTEFSPAAGKAVGEKFPYILLAAVDVYFEGAHITDLIAMLLK